MLQFPQEWSLYKVVWNSACVICLFFPFIFSKYFFVPAWTHAYLFYIVGYNPRLLKLFLTLFQLWPSRSCSWLLHHFDILRSLWGFLFCSFLYFLVLPNGPASSYIFLALILEVAISPRSPRAFYWRIWNQHELLGCTHIFKALSPRIHPMTKGLCFPLTTYQNLLWDLIGFFFF